MVETYCVAVRIANNMIMVVDMITRRMVTVMAVVSAMAVAVMMLSTSVACSQDEYRPDE